MRAGSSWQGEIKSTRKDGSTYWVYSSISPLPSSDGTITHFLGVNLDITDRKLAERALKQSEERLRTLMELSPVAMVLAQEGKPVLMNAAAERTSGYVRDELTEIPWRTLFREDHLSIVDAYFGKLLSGEDPGEAIEVAFVARDGSERWGLVEGRRFEPEDRPATIVTFSDVTPLRRIQQALEESEGRWRALVQSAPDMISMTDLDGVVISLNRTFSGAPPEVAIGCPLFDFVLPEDHETWRRAMSAVAETGEIQKIETRGRTVSGEVVWVASTLGPVFRDGVVVAISVVTSDVTGRRRTEDALRESESAVRLLLESAPGFISMLDRDGRFLSVSRALPHLDTESLIGQPVMDYVDPEFRDVVGEALDDVFDNCRVRRYEAVGEGPEGERIWYTTIVAPVVRDGKVAAATAITMDISERKRMELALRESEQRLLTLATAIPDLLLVLSGDGRCLEALVGRPERNVRLLDPGAVKGELLTDVLPGWQAEMLLAGARQALRSGQPVTVQHPFEAETGSYWIESRFAPIKNVDGEGAVAVMMLDITKQNELEQQLERLREEVEAQAEVQYEKHNPYRLTFREFTVLNLIASGKVDRQIAETLSISPATVGKHVGNIMRKMEVGHRAEAAAKAARERII
jgi:PAS domain S-box-containing protein